MTQDLFFSIIVPAHNEEKYLAKTLEHLAALNYPSESYEVIVIENGSTDATYDIARAHEGSHVHVYAYAQSGVSFARNRGLEYVQSCADWVVFLDADTIVLPDFLIDLSSTLRTHTHAVAGTTNVRPLGGTRVSRIWFRIYDGVHATFHNSWALFFVRADIARTLRFNEHAALMEDQQYLNASCKHGSFAFVPTDTVYTSTRRFDNDGWLRPILLYTLVGLLPAKLQELFQYGVVR